MAGNTTVKKFSNTQPEAPAVSAADSLMEGRFGRSAGFEKLTVGELAATLGEMRRLVEGMGSQLQLAEGHEVGGAGADENDEGSSLDDVQRLAAMLSRIEATNGA